MSVSYTNCFHLIHLFIIFYVKKYNKGKHICKCIINIYIFFLNVNIDCIMTETHNYVMMYT